eukprot:6197741-Pleurochrysis_carterae.AAC.1
MKPGRRVAGRYERARTAYPDLIALHQTRFGQEEATQAQSTPNYRCSYRLCAIVTFNQLSEPRPTPKDAMYSYGCDCVVQSCWKRKQGVVLCSLPRS